MTYYVWVDLETTGLNTESSTILEVASIITAEDYEPIDEYQAVIKPAGTVAYEPEALGFHKKSGLVDELHDGIPLYVAEQQLLAFVKKYEPTKRRAYLAGSSVHFDKRFMDMYMPSVTAHLCSRLLDVNAFALIARNKYGKDIQYKAARPHRALQDLHRSIAELKYYCQNLK